MAAGSIGLKAIFTADDRVTSKVAGMRSAVLGFTSSASKGLGQLDALNGKIWGGLKTGAVALGGLGLGASVVAKNVIDAGASFQAVMSGVSAVSGANAEEFSQLKARALELGTSTKYTATEVAGGFEIMAKAGLKVNQIIAATPGLLSAAAADGAGVEETAGNLMSAMKSLGLAPEKMGLFGDQMAKAGDSTAASINSISQSIGIAGPVLKQLNVPLASTIAQIALLQDAGIDPSSTGTQLAATYSKLAAPMGETKKAIASLGLQITDTYGNMKPPDKLFDEILGATSKIKGNAGKMAAFTHLVGLESQKALLNVASAAGDGRLKALVGDLENASGYADKIAAKRMDNFSGDVTLLQAAVSGLSIKLFDLESGPLRGVIQDMTQWVRVNQDLIVSGIGEKFKEWTPLVIGFGEGLRDGSKELMPVLKGVGQGLASVFGNGGSGQGPQAQAYFLAKNILKCAEAFAIFTIGTKVASGGLAAIELATKGAKVVGWMWDLGRSTKAAVDAFKIAQQVGPASLGALSGALDGVSSGAGAIGTSAVAAKGGIAGIASAAGAAAIPIGALAAMLAGIAATGYNIYALANESGGLSGLGEDTAGGVAGFFGSGTKSWGVNGFLEGYASTDDARKNLDALRAAKYEAPKWTNRSAGQAASDLTGLGRGYGRTPNDYLGAFGITPATGMAPPVAAPPPALARPVPTAEEFHAMVAQELTVKVQAAEGTTAEVTKKPKGSKVQLQPSGGFD